VRLKEMEAQMRGQTAVMEPPVYQEQFEPGMVIGV
jgi:hypothetical protein